MASKVIFYCDRCGVEFKRIGVTRSMHIHRKITDFLWMDNRCMRENVITLCKDCTEDFFKFIGGKNG